MIKYDSNVIANEPMSDEAIRLSRHGLPRHSDIIGTPRNDSMEVIARLGVNSRDVAISINKKPEFSTGRREK